MLFVEMEFSNGKKVYVNPDHVRYVTEDDCNKNMSNVSIHGITLHVKGEPKDLVRKFNNNVYLTSCAVSKR